jgi:hypothetical protein
VAEGLAGIYPHYVVLSKMGTNINSIANLSAHPSHPFYDFIKYFDYSTSDKGLTSFQSLINGYFDRLGTDLEAKLRMFKIVKESIVNELLFANKIYNTNRIK